MRTFTQRDKEIIDKIYNQNIGVDNLSTGGKLLFDNDFFPEGDIILLAPALSYACYLFKSAYNSLDPFKYMESYNGKTKQIVRDIIDTIALLDYLEEKGMIYVYERTGFPQETVIYFGNPQQEFDTFAPKYANRNDYYVCDLNYEELTFNINADHEIALRRKKGDDTTISMHGFSIKEKNAYNKLFHFYNGIIYATSSLEMLMNNKYKTDEEITLDQAKSQSILALNSLTEAKEQTKLARKTFKWSIFAIAVSIIMPIILNKSCTSDVRIEEKQFNSLIKDSVISEKVDSSLYYIKKISSQSAEAQKTAKQDSAQKTKSGKEQKKGH